jgi:TPR repeat protein
MAMMWIGKMDDCSMKQAASMRQLPVFFFLACALGLAACATSTPPGASKVSADAAKALQRQEAMQARSPDDVRSLAEAGNEDAIHNLCYRYRSGIDAPQDYAQAYSWCRNGALRDIPGSQTLFGELHYLGLGVPENHAVALVWYTKAALQEHHHALAILYRMHALGEGTPRDAQQALAFLKSAVMAGNDGAIAETAAIKAMASMSQPAAAERGDLDAQVDMGAYLAHGPLILRDQVRSADWYEKAAARGSWIAQNNLADIYEYGKGRPQDLARAVALFRQVAIQGKSVALHSLAQLYEGGKGLPQDAYLSYLYSRMAELARDDAEFQDEIAERCARLARTLPAVQVAAAEQFAAAWRVGKALPE